MKIELKIPTDQAAALTQLCKRITHVDLTTLAADIDEINTMDAGLAALRKALTVAEVEAELTELSI